ncbi:putative DNA polymerase [Shewanella phage SFCi1]|nr:putative DNA polymerase [Shewanella phage SFCi1]
MSSLISHPESDCVYWGNPSGPDYDQGCQDVALSDLRAGTVIENVGTYRSTVRPSMDFETYSEAGFVYVDGKVKGAGGGSTNGLGLVGTGVYAEHPSTEVLCLFYDLKDGKGRRGWWPGCPQPVDLLNHIANGGEIEAFNSTFEFFIWNFVCTRKYGWPQLQLEQTYCVMSMSRRWGLPGSLANAAKALGAEDKDKAGKNLIQKLCRPHTPTKNRPAIRRTMADSWPEFEGLFKYCDQDVATEDDVKSRLPDLTPYERETWLTDQRINLRGVLVDAPTLDAGLRLLQDATAHYTKELQQITQGEVMSVGEVAKTQAWLAKHGVHIADMRAETITEKLAEDMPPQCRRVLEIRQTLSSANVKKLAKLRHQLNSDDRLRNQYMYCGAERTGRWSSAAADDNASNSQLQNITAAGPASRECEACGRIFGAHLTDCPECQSFMCHDRDEWTVEAVECAAKDIRELSFEQVQHLWGNPIDLLCGCLRGLFIAKPGHDFICCDFSAVEAVALACLSRCEWRIEVFRTHGKIYEMSASKITGIPFEDMMAYKKETKMHHPSRKKVGKVAELASGYGGWTGAWCAFGADEFMDEAEIKKNVLAWRAESPEIVEFWGGQFRQTGPKLSDGHPEYFGLEGAAIQAVLYPGQCFWANDISYGVHNDVLYCRLPSGRLLAYHQPRLVEVAGKWGKPNSYSLTFMGFNTNPKNGPRGWVRMETYGGRLAENCIAEGTEVLTDAGWVCIEDVTPAHKVHDGVEFVNHGGLLFKSEQTCVSIDGVYMTPDHEVLTNDGWKAASQDPRPYRPALRDADGIATGLNKRTEAQVGLSVSMRGGVREEPARPAQERKEGAGRELRVPDIGADSEGPANARHERAPTVRCVAVDVRQVPPSDAPSMGQLRGERDQGLPGVGREVRGVLRGHGADIQEGAAAGPQGQRLGVHPSELSMGAGEGQLEQQTIESSHLDADGYNDRGTSCGAVRDRGDDFALSTVGGVASGETVHEAGRDKPRRVFDILNAGPRSRFVVRGDAGPFVVHNCTQAVCADIQAEALVRCEKAGYPIVMHTHDEGCAEVPEGFGSVEEMCAIMGQAPEWASWWPLKAAGWRHKRYQKD